MRCRNQRWVNNGSTSFASAHGGGGVGMTVLEMVLALAMLVVFTGVVATVLQFTVRFMGEAESGAENEDGVVNGVLIDHQLLQIAMDQLVEMLSQPGIPQERVQQISADPSDASIREVCVDGNPVSAWSLPPASVLIPPGYSMCLWRTTAGESSLEALLAKSPGAKPGIYVLQALPDRLSASTLPSRRLFCRPRPFC